VIVLYCGGPDQWADYSNPHWREGHATLLGKKGSKTSHSRRAGAPQARKGGEAWV
jgi:hypothetical protein